MGNQSPVPLLRRLASRRRPGKEIRWQYDELRQVTRIETPRGWVDSWDAEVLAETKKFDVETGEDQKGT
jgi:YD repeat-containing protein